MKLHQKLFLLLAGLVVATAGLLNVQNFRRNTRDIDRNLRLDQRQKLTALAQVSHDAMLAGNDLALVDYAKIVKPLNEYALWAAVVRENGEVVAHTDPEEIGKTVSVPPEAHPDDLLFVAPVEAGGATLGWIRMAVDKEKLGVAAETARQTARRRSWQAFAWAIGLGLPLSRLLAHRAVRPLKRVLQTAHEIAEGHLEARAEVGSADELGDLGTQVNAMAEMLATAKAGGREGAALKLAHDLKSPLAAIQSYLDVVSESEEHQEDVQQNLAAIKASAERLSNLVTDVLEKEKALEGKAEAALEPIALEAALQRVYLMHKIEAEQKGLIFMEPGLPFGMPKVLARQDHLFRVLDNLVTNAIKYTPRYGSAWMEVDIKGPEVWVMVNDTGVGIEPADLPNLFQRFKRGQAPEVQQRSGVGLGLFVARQLVELMGGRAWAASRGKGQGSTFVFTLQAVFDEVTA